MTVNLRSWRHTRHPTHTFLHTSANTTSTAAVLSSFKLPTARKFSSTPKHGIFDIIKQKICKISNLVISETERWCFTNAKETWYSVHHVRCNLAEKFQLCLLPYLKGPTKRSHGASNMANLEIRLLDMICHLSSYEGKLCPSRIKKWH